MVDEQDNEHNDANVCEKASEETSVGAKARPKIKSEIKLEAIKEHYPALTAFVDEKAKEIGFSKQALYNINLAAEEAIVNVLNYAYPGKKQHISVVCEEVKTPKKGMKLIISDKGIAFNPMQRAKVDTTQSIEKRPIGGLGIHMIQKVAHQVEYDRIDDENIFTLTFYLP